MNCSQARDHFSLRLDGNLGSQDLADLNLHLATCPACTEDWRTQTASLAALRAAPRAVTSPELGALILGAVDQADSAAHPVPLAAVLPLPRRSRARRTASHLAALAAGAAAALLFRTAPSELPPGPQPGPPPTPLVEFVDREVLVERIVEVPVERIVEKLVERRIEVPIEVPRIEYRDPTPTLHAAGRRALASFARNMRFVAGTLAREQAPPTTIPVVAQVPSEPAAQARTIARTAPHARLAEASVQVERSNGRISLSIHGPLRKVVPILLAKLGDPDPSLVAVVERRLGRIRSAAEDDPLLGPALVDPPGPRPARAIFGRARATAEDLRSPQERWRSWWEANGERIGDAGSRLRI